MPKQETKIRTPFVCGKKKKTTRERYEFFFNSLLASEQILRGKDCIEKEIAAIHTARVTLKDTSDKEIKNEFEQVFNKALEECYQRGQCEICRK